MPRKAANSTKGDPSVITTTSPRTRASRSNRKARHKVSKVDTTGGNNDNDNEVVVVDVDADVDEDVDLEVDTDADADVETGQASPSKNKRSGRKERHKMSKFATTRGNDDNDNIEVDSGQTSPRNIKRKKNSRKLPEGREESAAPTTSPIVARPPSSATIQQEDYDSFDDDDDDDDSQDSDFAPGAVWVDPEGENVIPPNLRQKHEHDGAISSQELCLQDEDLTTTTTLEVTSSLGTTNTTMTLFDAEIVKETDFEATLSKRMKDRTVDAEKVQTVPQGDDTRESSRCSKAGVLLLLAGVICLAMVVTVLGVTSRKDSPNVGMSSNDIVPSPTTGPTRTDTPAPTMTDFEVAVDLFSELSGSDILMDEATPQHQALSWLVDIDTANVLSNETMGSLSSTSIERYVMAVLYFATGGPEWMDEANFLNESSVCGWSSVEHGARCNDQGSVISIRFVNNNLNGTIPSEISALSNLEQLTAFQSSLYGTIPESIGALTNLQVLQFGFSDISGSIPSTFTKLTKLAVMWMPANQFTGTLPQDLFLQLSSLEAINLSLSFITGTIPEFAIDQAILVFRLNAAMVSGKIPESIYMPTLNTLSFYGNQLSGSISSKIGELQELETFNVASNKLTGTLPTELGLARDLEVLALSSNFISGTIPSELGLLDRLVELVMEINTLTGSVPAEFSTLSAGKVGLHTNNLTGGFGAFCDQPALQSKVSADCYGLDPLVDDCPCCTTCYDSSTGESEIILQSVCEIEQVSYDNEVGTSYIEGAGTKCNCTSTVDIATLSCVDTQCQMCNRAGTVCAINQEFGTRFDDAGGAVMHKAEFQYVVGRDDTVTFETQYEQFYGWFCSVYVNGQLCNSCQLEICKDNESGYYVDCQNVEGAGIFEACGTNEADEIDEEGPLAVFSLQDPFRRDGCPPRFFKNF